MKIIDFQAYKSRHELKKLQECVGKIAQTSKVGAAQEIKVSFKKFVRLQN